MLISNCGVFPYHWYCIGDEKMKSFKIMCFKRKPEKFLMIVDMNTSGTKIVDIPMSKISYERQGKIIEETILQTRKFVPAFLSSHYLSCSLRYDFVKINIYMIQQRRNVLRNGEYLCWSLKARK